MISLTNYDFQWARSELVIIYPDFIKINTTLKHHATIPIDGGDPTIPKGHKGSRIPMRKVKDTPPKISRQHVKIV